MPHIREPPATPIPGLAFKKKRTAFAGRHTHFLREDRDRQAKTWLQGLGAPGAVEPSRQDTPTSDRNPIAACGNRRRLLRPRPPRGVLEGPMRPAYFVSGTLGLAVVNLPVDKTITAPDFVALSDARPQKPIGMILGLLVVFSLKGG